MKKSTQFNFRPDPVEIRITKDKVGDVKRKDVACFDKQKECLFRYLMDLSSMGVRELLCKEFEELLTYNK